MCSWISFILFTFFPPLDVYRARRFPFLATLSLENCYFSRLKKKKKHSSSLCKRKAKILFGFILPASTSHLIGKPPRVPKHSQAYLSSTPLNSVALAPNTGSKILFYNLEIRFDQAMQSSGRQAHASKAVSVLLFAGSQRRVLSPCPPGPRN